MNQLTKLIEQYEKENPGQKAFTRNYNKYGNEQPPTYNNEFVKWQANEIEKLTSRPTCGEDQRKFLDEIEGIETNQKDIPPDIADVLNKRFMDLF